MGLSTGKAPESTTLEPFSPMTLVSSQTRDQNSGTFSTDHVYKSLYVLSERPNCLFTTSRRRNVAVESGSDGDQRQWGREGASMWVVVDRCGRESNVSPFVLSLPDFLYKEGKGCRPSASGPPLLIFYIYKALVSSRQRERPFHSPPSHPVSPFSIEQFFFPMPLSSLDRFYSPSSPEAQSFQRIE